MSLLAPADASDFLRLITANAGVSTLCIAFGSSVYSGGLRDLVAYFKEDTVVITLGLSIYVLGFALGTCKPSYANLEQGNGRALTQRFHRSASLGAILRAVGTSTRLHLHLLFLRPLRTSLRTRQEHRDAPYLPLPRRLLRLEPAHQQWRRHCRLVQRARSSSCDVALCAGAFRWSRCVSRVPDRTTPS